MTRLMRYATGRQSRSLQQGAPLGERSPVYHSCEPAGNAEAAIATIVATRTTNDRIFSNLQSASTKSCGSENLRRILFGDPSFLRE
jgi:hypothetical protein